MPTYEYECDKCRRVFEIRQRISEPALTICDACGGAVRRLLHPAPFILKGDGWYVTDYPSESRKKAMASEKKDGSKGGSSTAATAEKTESKGDAKTESKGDAKIESKTESKGQRPGASHAATSPVKAPAPVPRDAPAT